MAALTALTVGSVCFGNTLRPAVIGVPCELSGLPIMARTGLPVVFNAKPFSSAARGPWQLLGRAK